MLTITPQLFLKKIRAKIRHILIGNLSYEHLDLKKEIEKIRLAIGKQETRTIRNSTFHSIQEAEFRVYSQFGDDGIIQYLINKVATPNKIFIELGVGDYSESNTRFLLVNDNWQGKIVNSGTEHIDFIHSKELGDFYYRYNITAISTFIDKTNVNSLIKDMNVPTDIGILSIDLDGVDYWIWEAITTLSPRIVIMEYNSHFGDKYAFTVPYKKDFDRTHEHYSNLYFGASLPAICLLARKKGYQFVGSNSAGVNAYFVRQDVAGKLPKLTAKKGYVKNLYRDSKDEKGNFTYIERHEERRKLIANKKVFDVKKEELTTIEELFNS
jgi:hypothetical protein